MSKLILSKEKKITLLRVLQSGFVDDDFFDTVQAWDTQHTQEMTDEELKEQICKIDFSLYPENCKNRIANGLCYLDNGRTDYPHKYNEIRRGKNKQEENNADC